MNGTPLSLLVDTGAAVTLMSKETWDDIRPTTNGKLKPWFERQLVSVDRTALQVFGSMEAELTLGSRKFQSEIIVVSPLTTQAILGVDFLKEYEAQIDFSSGQLKFGGCIGGNLSKQQQEQFHNLLVQYVGLFAESKLDTGRTD